MRRSNWVLLLRPDRPEAEPGEPAAFDPAARGTWAWVRPHRFRPAWNLVVDGVVVATLAARGPFHQSAEARVAGGGWTFRRAFPADVRVVPAGAGAPVARFRSGWFGGGRIERVGRETLLLRRESFWRHRFGLLTPERLPLVHVLPRHAPFAIGGGAEVELEDAARRLDDLAMLLALTWFLVLRSGRSHAAHG